MAVGSRTDEEEIGAVHENCKLLQRSAKGKDAGGQGRGPPCENRLHRPHRYLWLSWGYRALHHQVKNWPQRELPYRDLPSSQA